MKEQELMGALEALLFVSDEPVSAAQLARILEVGPGKVDSALAFLATRFAEEERGIQLREVAGGWRLYSHPAYHELIEHYVASWDTRALSTAALETLAVVAYHQPVTRAEINSIRGVNSEGVVLSLVEKGLLREMGRSGAPGNAIIYGTSRAFLERFGLASLKDLPPLADFAPDAVSRDYIRQQLIGGASAIDAGESGQDDLTDARLILEAGDLANVPSDFPADELADVPLASQKDNGACEQKAASASARDLSV
ncbi:MAG: SMC-Scp complex subunit ScpB [Coriobacteriales bacterium]|jgi:segregation and condensation protein B|nr:SMC-Scp complex subunit ScpB [Coriobacteriales bacterium]